MNATAIGWIVTCAFIVILIIGFFVGFWRGLKKSTANLVFSVIGAIVAFFVTPLISSLILSINIDNNGVQMSLSEYIIDSLTQNESISVIIERNPNIQTLIEALPSAIANVVVFILVMIAVQILIYIIYRIIACFTFKTPLGLKKHRVWGGVIGFAKVFVLTVFAFMPIAGLIGMYDTLQTTQANYLLVENNNSVEENESGDLEDGTASESDETTSVSQETDHSTSLIEQYVPQEVSNIMGGLENNMLIKICGIFGLDNATFDYYSSVKVGDNNVYIRQEIETVYPIVEFAYQLSQDNSNITFEDVNYQKLEEFVNNFTDGGLFKSIVVDLASDIILNYQEYPFLNDVDISQYEDILEPLQRSIQVYSQEHELLENYFINDVKQIFSAVSLLGQEGLLDEIANANDEEQMLDILFSDANLQTTESAMIDLLNVNMVRDAIVPIANLAISKIDEQIGQITISTDTWVEEDWESLSSSIVNIVNNFINLTNSLPENTDIMQLLEDPTILITNNSINLSNITGALGEILDDAISIKLFYTQEGNSIIADFLNENNISLPTEIIYDNNGEVVNIDSYSDLFDFITPALNRVKSTNLYELLNNDDPNEIITSLASLISTEGNENLLTDVILPLSQVEPTKTIIVDELLQTIDTDLISFANIEGYYEWKSDLGYISDLLITTNSLSYEGSTYLNLLLSGDLDTILVNIDGEEFENILKPILYAKSTASIRGDLFNSLVEVVDSLTTTTNQLNLEGITLVEGEEDDQAQEICDVFTAFLEINHTFSEGMTIQDLDKTALSQLLTAMQSNSYRVELLGKSEEGLFYDMYNNILTSIKTSYQDAIALSEELQTMLEEENYPYIDFTELFNLIEEVETSLEG